MLIIIEGADKTGKTTLAKEIERRLGYKYHHFGAPGSDPAGEYVKFLMDMEEPTVCDRFFYGEMVYGPLLRGKSLITNVERMVIERLCRARNALLVHACTPLTIANERIKQLGDDMITQDQNAEAYSRFAEVLANSSLPTLSFSSVYLESTDNFILNRLDALSNSMRRVALRAKEVITGIGTIDRPRVVIVGEELNKNATWVGVPFDKGPSADFLNDCLMRAGILEGDLYVVNASTITQSEANYLQTNNSPKFVALGAKASIKLSKLSIEHTAIPHPMYWKRFHYAKKNEYIKMLWVAAS